MTDRQWKTTVKRTDSELLDGLERLVDTGDCPAVINDDKGHWAVSAEGMQSIRSGDGPDDVETSFFIPATKFRTSIREAIDDYLDDCLNEHYADDEGA